MEIISIVSSLLPESLLRLISLFISSVPSAVRQIAQGYEREGLSPDLAIDTAVKFVIGQTGHPIYKGPRSSAYKLKGLAHDPMETLF